MERETGREREKEGEVDRERKGLSYLKKEERAFGI